VTKIVAGDRGGIEEAARVLRAGGLVAFPTETVYGLGAVATDEAAVRRVFHAKGRPPDNPLIVHVDTVDHLDGLVRDVPRAARDLARAFWPGPLAIVLLRAPAVPDVVTAGRDTVAVRVPDHPVALALLALAGPLAAPSANSSGRPSPTRAEHVAVDLGDRVDLVLDGGPCAVGLESTVVDLTCDPPLVLRPGGVAPEEIARVCGGVRLHPGVVRPFEDADARAPGMRHRHYRPDAEIVLVEGDPAEAADHARALAAADPDGAYVGLGEAPGVGPAWTFATVPDLARGLFETLRAVDREGIRRAYVAAVPATGLGLALMNRLRKAASRIERVP
jgi:L-threonylcarbamoyladenylate synthase